jgi:hypothetical protein
MLMDIIKFSANVWRKKLNKIVIFEMNDILDENEMVL